MKNSKVYVIGKMKMEHDIEYVEDQYRIQILYNHSFYSSQECGKTFMDNSENTYEKLTYNIK